MKTHPIKEALKKFFGLFDSVWSTINQLPPIKPEGEEKGCKLDQQTLPTQESKETPEARIEKPFKL